MNPYQIDSRVAVDVRAQQAGPQQEPSRPPAMAMMGDALGRLGVILDAVDMLCGRVVGGPPVQPPGAAGVGLSLAQMPSLLDQLSEMHRRLDALESLVKRLDQAL